MEKYDEAFITELLPYDGDPLYWLRYLQESIGFNLRPLHHILLTTGLKLSLDDSFGNLNIGISNNSYSYVSGHSWNGLYSATILDGELKLRPLLSIGRSVNEMKVNDVVKDIWESYVKPYLYR